MLVKGEIISVREAIDSIGFICFCNVIPSEENVIDNLLNSINKYPNDKIVRWKTVRAFESFRSMKSIMFLKSVELNDDEEIIKIEAKRALEIFGGR